ncbi:hypothetical protein J4399_04910 [Candidatus Woesearchaeota archaeon]|nr:hypothetical protein [Candidatus Woesearchaeota archaeon]HIJ01357.1 hypothetical protein [Candidatus Woesearchaeota archaeon]
MKSNVCIETGDEKHKRIGCTGNLVETVRDEVQKKINDTLSYTVTTVGDDSIFTVRMVVDGSKNPAISDGMVAISVKCMLTEETRGHLWWKEPQKTVMLNIGIDLKFLSGIILDEVMAMFKSNENNFRRCLSGNIHLKDVRIRMVFGLID